LGTALVRDPYVAQPIGLPAVAASARAISGELLKLGNTGPCYSQATPDPELDHSFL